LEEITETSGLDHELPETAEERRYLEQRFEAEAVEPRPLPVLNTLKKSGLFDLLHFACHGDIMHSRLMMEGRLQNDLYVPAYLDTSLIEQNANLQAPDGTRSMVVLNACQSGRAGFKLTGLGGFAQAFLGNGAGAFIGALWSVGDYPARTFTEAFYNELSQGTALARATKTAGDEARKAGDATWLAYAVYGHPHAVLRTTQAS